MKKILVCIAALAAFAQFSEAQTTRYIVKFTDKGSNPYSLSNPSAYLSQRAIDRRNRYSVSIDSTDLPITPRYIDSVVLSGSVILLNRSKWLNSISIKTSDAAALAKISSLPFVQSVTGIGPRIAGPLQPNHKFETDEQPLVLKEMGITSDFYNYGSSFGQIHIHNGEFLHNIGLRGQNMILGMLDAGFNNYLTVNAIDSARKNGQILGVYDFVAKDSSVNEDNAHGMECFSTIAANMPGQFVGTAPKANFYLFRTEDAATEYPIEEHNWVCGAERIDSAGGDVISSSLGYNNFDAPFTAYSHTYADMNGNTTMAAIGADLAAKKGMLVVIAAGNEGNSAWHYITTPADADSVLAVGAVNTSGVVGSFSSYGPSSDGQLKPDVAAVGVAAVVQFPNNAIGTSNGTSFACPNMAGLSTCLWQGFPEFNNMKIVNALRQSGSIAPAPDNHIGYGIPDMKKATLILLKQFATSSVSVSNCTATLSWTSKDVNTMKYVIERMTSAQNSFIKIGEQQGTGNTFSTRSYQFLDDLQNVPTGSVTYRILQVIDTSSTGLNADYIDTTTTSLNFSCTGNEGVVVIPNPVVNTLTLKVSTSQNIPELVINVYNTTGQLITTLKKNQPQGTIFYPIALPLKLASGKYYVKVNNGRKVFATKEFVKL